MKLTALLENTGALGALTAAMGCASCFPALGSLGAALGLGFLAQYEGLFINTLLPLFAAIALAANIFSFISHRIIHRMLIGIAGPTMVLLTMFPLWTYDWSTWLLYAGIALMLVVAIWDLLSPPSKVCASCNIPETGDDQTSTENSHV